MLLLILIWSYFLLRTQEQNYDICLFIIIDMWMSNKSFQRHSSSPSISAANQICLRISFSISTGIYILCVYVYVQILENCTFNITA